MHAQSITQKDPATSVSPPIRPMMPWRVAEVKALDQYRLHVKFNDGSEGDVSLAGLVKSVNAGVFAALSDTSLFGQVFVEHGAVTWPGEIDLAPDAMYAAIKKDGKWML